MRCLIAAVVLGCALASCSAPPREATVGTASLTPTPEVTATPTATAQPTPSPSPTAGPAKVFEPKWDELPVAAEDQDLLAQQLLALEQAIRDPAISDLQRAWMGHLQQLVYSQLADHPDWQEPVLAKIPSAMRPPVLGALEASRQLRTMHFTPPRSFPDWKIVAPRPADELMRYYREAEAAFGVPWYYLASINLIETRMGRIRGVSTAGAQGPMQFMPATWAAYGQGNVEDDHDAILGAARYLKANGAPGDMQRALYAYNHSLGYVGAIVAYAEVMKADALAYRGYHGWQVYYTTQDGTFLLPVGWTKPAS